MTMLSGADTMKIGLVTRKDPKSNEGHNLLQVDTRTPIDLSVKMMTMDIKSAWNIVLKVVQALQAARSSDKKESFRIIRDPSKAQLKIFRVPDEELEGDDSDSDSNSDSDSDSDSGSD
eukprot:Sspe_Gene.1101::Locus_371_Transcript_1_1_Confidence_1.000_Length_1822::g.1101::m.1101